jgi:hypothetical protein
MQWMESKELTQFQTLVHFQVQVLTKNLELLVVEKFNNLKNKNKNKMISPININQCYQEKAKMNHPLLSSNEMMI